MRTFHWEGSLAAEGGGASWGHPLALGGWDGFSQEGQTLEEACLSQGLAPAGTFNTMQNTCLEATSGLLLLAQQMNAGAQSANSTTSQDGSSV